MPANVAAPLDPNLPGEIPEHPTHEYRGEADGNEHQPFCIDDVRHEHSCSAASGKGFPRVEPSPQQDQKTPPGIRRDAAIANGFVKTIGGVGPGSLATTADGVGVSPPRSIPEETRSYEQRTIGE